MHEPALPANPRRRQVVLAPVSGAGNKYSFALATESTPGVIREPLASNTPRCRKYDATGSGVTFASPLFDEEIEFTGPLAAKLFVSSSTTDADLFLRPAKVRLHGPRC